MKKISLRQVRITFALLGIIFVSMIAVVRLEQGQSVETQVVDVTKESMGSSRGIASQFKTVTAKDIQQWNQSVQARLKKQGVVNIADQSLSRLERFQFEDLKGRFRIWTSPGNSKQITKIESDPSRDSEISDLEVEQIILKMSEFSPRPYSRVLPSGQDAKVPTKTSYLLLNSADKEVGKAIVTRTATSGQIHSIEIQ